MALLFFSFPSHRIGTIVLHVSDRRFHVFCVFTSTCGHKSTPLSCIKASCLIDQVKEKLWQHYSNVLNRPLPPSPINVDDVATVSPDLNPPNVTSPIATARLRAALSTSKLFLFCSWRHSGHRSADQRVQRRHYTYY